SNYYENDGTPALEPGRPAEKRPPYKDSQPTQESPKHPHYSRARNNNRNYKPDQPLKYYNDNAGPQSECLLLGLFIG
ncbi:MAG: hypothetical protein KAS29_02445, partial [Bacteroidales bacterium]|nr:hypothetical protein [Bacteroidales bacterium]